MDSTKDAGVDGGYPAWRVIIRDVGVAELEQLAARHDLVLLAAGKADIVKLLFARTRSARSSRQPQRALALTYVQGMRPSTPFPRVSFNLIPRGRRVLRFPSLTTSSPQNHGFSKACPAGQWTAGRASPRGAAPGKSLELVRRYTP
ncbi:styrene monooxygenase/indole monooxygenase family protein [Pseudomonas peli]|uniref:styrene monooxygenase/indole monooxygenase family protein n=1 Tax=Pseudomonas peli TaxID=592361 RepID=UPI0024ACF94B|nr:styrene monooxygenase/indole monooxygenase family protein [Pseudomonas peli]